MGHGAGCAVGPVVSCSGSRWSLGLCVHRPCEAVAGMIRLTEGNSALGPHTWLLMLWWCPALRVHELCVSSASLQLLSCRRGWDRGACAGCPLPSPAHVLTGALGALRLVRAPAWECAGIPAAQAGTFHHAAAPAASSPFRRPVCKLPVASGWALFGSLVILRTRPETAWCSLPGKAAAGALWWLGSGWYQLVTLMSWLNVVLLTR